MKRNRQEQEAAVDGTTDQPGNGFQLCNAEKKKPSRLGIGRNRQEEKHSKEVKKLHGGVPKKSRDTA